MRSGPHFLAEVFLSEVRAWAVEEPVADELWRAFGSPATTAPPADDIRSALDARRVYVDSPPRVDRMTWAGQPELILLQQLLGVRIALLCSTEARQPSVHSLGGESDNGCAIVDDRPCIHLGYASNEHYFSVVGVVAGADVDELQLMMADSPMKRQAQQLMLDDGWEEMKKARKQAVKFLDDDRSSDCGGVSTDEQSSKSCFACRRTPRHSRATRCACARSTW
jgi:hypothetical protein